MDHLTTTVFGITAWRLYSSAALVAMYFALKLKWAREEEMESDSGEVKRAPVNDMLNPLRVASPDVNLTDTQRIDLLYRSFTLRAKERVDLKDLSFGRIPQMAMTLLEIELASGREFAHIKVELGGSVADCGKLVQQIGDNDFLVPRSEYLDPLSTIHFTCSRGNAVSFLEFKVSQIDLQKNQATIDVKHVRGRSAV